MPNDCCVIRRFVDVYPHYRNEPVYGEITPTKFYPQADQMWVVTLEPGCSITFKFPQMPAPQRQPWIEVYSSIDPVVLFFNLNAGHVQAVNPEPLIRGPFANMTGQPQHFTLAAFVFWGVVRDNFGGIRDGQFEGYDTAYLKPTGPMRLGVDDRGGDAGPDWDDLVVDIVCDQA